MLCVNEATQTDISTETTLFPNIQNKFIFSNVSNENYWSEQNIGEILYRAVQCDFPSNCKILALKDVRYKYI